MIGFWCLLAGVVLGYLLGYLLGYARGVDACTPRRWKAGRSARLNLSSKGSLGNVRRGSPLAQDGRAGSAADRHTPEQNPRRSVNGEALAPDLSEVQRAFLCGKMIERINGPCLRNKHHSGDCGAAR